MSFSVFIIYKVYANLDGLVDSFLIFFDFISFFFLQKWCRRVHYILYSKLAIVLQMQISFATFLACRWEMSGVFIFISFSFRVLSIWEKSQQKDSNAIYLLCTWVIESMNDTLRVHFNRHSIIVQINSCAYNVELCRIVCITLWLAVAYVVWYCKQCVLCSLIFRRTLIFPLIISMQYCNVYLIGGNFRFFDMKSSMKVAKHNVMGERKKKKKPFQFIWIFCQSMKIKNGKDMLLIASLGTFLYRPYDNRWSKTMVGYGPESTHFVVELTYNYGVKSYDLGMVWLRHIDGLKII